VDDKERNELIGKLRPRFECKGYDE